MSHLNTPDWLDEYADLLARAGADAKSVRAHASDHTRVRASTLGLLSRVQASHERFRAAAIDDCAQVARAARTGERGLRAAARRYREAERAAGSCLDRAA